MRKNEPVLKIASKNLITAHTGQPLSEVRKLLAEHSFHHVPVVSGEKLVGIITSTDFFRLEVSAYGGSDERTFDSVLDHQFSIEDVMQKDVKSLSTGSTVRDAALQLSNAAYHSLPIVDDEGNLKGIVTSTDLIKYLLEQY